MIFLPRVLRDAKFETSSVDAEAKQEPRQHQMRRSGFGVANVSRVKSFGFVGPLAGDDKLGINRQQVCSVPWREDWADVVFDWRIASPLADQTFGLGARRSHQTVHEVFAFGLPS